MDELFLMPPSPVAMPRAYWLDQPFFSSQLVLISPSKHEWARVSAFMHRDDSGFDMDILNDMYKDSCIVIPHRRYNLITGEFREEMHERYLGSDEAWNGAKAIEEAKFVHFSDWPVPKPWLEASSEVMKKHQPKCRYEEDGKGKDCTDRDIWLELYKDFSRRRKVSANTDHEDERIVDKKYSRYVVTVMTRDDGVCKFDCKSTVKVVFGRPVSEVIHRELKHTEAMYRS
jgi:alpha-N-acetylglucosamine transferase